MNISKSDPAKNHQYGSKSFCLSCMYFIENSGINAVGKIVKMIDGKRKTIHLKKDATYCNYDELKKINRNHIRWWGFSQHCPFNIYTHTCLGCGIRMCSYKMVCSGCKKNNERFMHYSELTEKQAKRILKQS